MNAEYSRPFKRNGSLYRWMTIGSMMYLQYFNRLQSQWLSARDGNGIFIVKSKGRKSR